MVVHNSHGNAIASLSKQAPLPFSPVIVEAMAAARVITFAQELGIKEFVLKGDSEVVITTLQSTEVSLTTYGHLLESAKSILTTSKCIAFTHICRIGNKVAHNLAKHVDMLEVCRCGWKIFHHSSMMYSLLIPADFLIK